MTSASAERLGPFDLVALLGEGGSARVYAAEWDGREVALKVQRHEDRGGSDRFLEEASRLARLAHPSLVPLLAHGKLPDGRGFLVMPRLPGEALSARLSRRGPLPHEQALSLFAQLCSAVGALHEVGLLHRDLKPDNVILTDEGRRAVLIDLGIARDEGAPASTTTAQGVVRGTPAYMAPERVFGHPASVRSEVYELGVLLYAALTARLPWDEADPHARLLPRPPSAWGIEVGEPLSQALLQTLSTRPEARPESVFALASLIEEASHEAASFRARRTEDQPAQPDPRAPDRPPPATGPAPAAQSDALAPPPGPLSARSAANALLARPSRWASLGGVAPPVALAVVAAAAGAVGARSWLVSSPTSAPPVSASPLRAAPPAVEAEASALPSADPAGGLDAASALPPGPTAVSPGPSAPAAAPAPSARAASAVSASAPFAEAAAASPAAASSAGPSSQASGLHHTDADLARYPACRDVITAACSPELRATEGTQAGTICWTWRLWVDRAFVWNGNAPNPTARCEELRDNMRKLYAGRVGKEHDGKGPPPAASGPPPAELSAMVIITPAEAMRQPSCAAWRSLWCSKEMIEAAGDTFCTSLTSSVAGMSVPGMKLAQVEASCASGLAYARRVYEEKMKLRLHQAKAPAPARKPPR